MWQKCDRNEEAVTLESVKAAARVQKRLELNFYYVATDMFDGAVISIERTREVTIR